jgi:hypothetical protein
MAASSKSLAQVDASFGLAAFRIAAYSSLVSRTPSSAPRTWLRGFGLRPGFFFVVTKALY